LQTAAVRAGRRSAVWDQVVFAKAKAALGGRVRLMCSGSAPLAPPLAEFMRVCFGAVLVEGYGLTETHGGSHAASFAAAAAGIVSEGGAAGAGAGAPQALGHVGQPLPCCEMKLRSVPELGYCTDDLPCPRGEVLVRGLNVFSGYYQPAPEAGSEAAGKAQALALAAAAARARREGGAEGGADDQAAGGGGGGVGGGSSSGDASGASDSAAIAEAEAEAASALTADGWLCTGDIGRFNRNGTLSIVDRKKNIFKLAQGEYVAPEQVEGVLQRNKFVGQVRAATLTEPLHCTTLHCPALPNAPPCARSSCTATP
jgi:long-subunit acyl-CoA synthetase (AMP-forming)